MITDRTLSPLFDSVINYFGISPRTKAGHFSHGQRAGLHLAMTLAIEAELLMLDDPATGLDSEARRSLLEAMIYFTRRRERTIFFSTHLLDDVERVTYHVAVLDYRVLRVCCIAHAVPAPDGTEVFEPAGLVADLVWTAK